MPLLLSLSSLSTTGVKGLPKELPRGGGVSVAVRTTVGFSNCDLIRGRQVNIDIDTFVFVCDL